MGRSYVNHLVEGHLIFEEQSQRVCQQFLDLKSFSTPVLSQTLVSLLELKKKKKKEEKCCQQMPKFKRNRRRKYF